MRNVRRWAVVLFLVVSSAGALANGTVKGSGRVACPNPIQDALLR
ncbi:hypothetical protein Trad_1095 [Truepera radiovictrix DSM 17093]|uniref:Uncharacterized protein n=1 Tax=Truepera radiovictrix (strain DSM 17093 / CIP 108686 / LMG 22925 / RQ-24) TaxID=649638 RepID=D7CVJ4_TRURR|nr:hypothetical protein Trad_1095 [Truepera radiovictrix DSM 17093]